MAWTLQRSRRPKGWYWQVVHGRGKERLSLTLGYLTEDEVLLARQHIGSMPGPDLLVVEAWDGDGEPPAPSKTAQATAAKAWLMDTSVAEAIAALEEQATREAQRRIARGDYSALTLRDFYDEMWWPVRKREAAASTVRGEKPYWTAILDALGGVRLRDLSMARWSAFLATRAEHGGSSGRPWGGRAQSLCQNAYRQALKYATEIGALSEVHAFRQIKNSTKPTLEPVEPLTVDELHKVLGAAPSVMHRALFAFAVGQGLRPGEAAALQWQDVDWSENQVRIRGTKTTKSDAVVPMMDLTRMHLEAWWRKAGQPAEGPAFVRGGKQIREWKTAWKNACTKAGIERRITCYMARHTFATLAVVEKSTPAALRTMMRHSQRSTILEQAYERLNAAQVREGMSFPKIKS